MSIATRTAITLSALIGLIFIISGVASYDDSSRRSRESGLATLDHYARQLAQQQEARFARIRSTHARASELLRAELAGNPALDNAAVFDTLFPTDPRGGRRSADALFTGGNTVFGHVRGVGAFIPREPDLAARRRLIAATGVVSQLGEGVRPELESLYYFTPDNALVIFAADRADQLRFYRKDAPSTLDFQRQEFATVTTRAANPARTMRCTALRHIMYDRTGGTWTTGCMTPIDLDGRHVGSWGTSVLLDSLIPANEFDDVPGTGVILISREGRLIHHPDYTHQKKSGPESMLDLTATRDPRLAALWSFVQQHRDGNFLGEAEGLGSFVAMRRIETPGWYALVVQDAAVMQAESNRLILRVALTAAICLVLQALAIALLMRRRVGEPLARLIERTRALTRRVPSARFVDVDRVATRDEVAQLTHDFDIMAARIGSAQSELERKVADRTKALRRANLELKLIATRDPLTGIPSRRHLASEIDARLAVLGGEGHYLLAFDVDHLKRINEVHGEETGDRALINIANGIAALLREGDLCGRIGGAEFGAFVRADCQAEAMTVAERVRTGLYGLETPGRYGEMIRVTVSAGVTGASIGDRFDSLLLRAEAALEQAKRGGRDRAVWHRPAGRRQNTTMHSA
ncbi:diguanylate cyclase domain-containing protein [Sphingomonas sp.]|jgi:diguanylate cyclase (GGDEF)-like protein|uniref:diguanylate cyclase domain-containing protein n=1 Tax=Sphingomonas sp. TaxID=28214 RepID=UPI002E1240F5|nr:diguanylate cyclase [Sphingomonas sp.]